MTGVQWYIKLLGSLYFTVYLRGLLFGQYYGLYLNQLIILCQDGTSFTVPTEEKVEDEANRAENVL